MNGKKAGNFVLNEVTLVKGKLETFNMDQTYNLNLDEAKQIINFAFLAEWKASGSLNLKAEKFSDGSLSGVVATGQIDQKGTISQFSCALSFLD
jgi:hypothetical protein